MKLPSMFKRRQRPGQAMRQAGQDHANAEAQERPSWLRRFAFFMIRPLQVGLAAGLTLYALNWAQYLYQQHFGPYGGYSLMGMNYNDMAVSHFSVNNAYGGNVFAGDPEGGGKSTCCLTIERDAKTAVVRWAISRTHEEIKQGLPDIEREAIVPLPKLDDPHEGYIGAHFLPNGKVVLTYSKWYPEPIQPIKEIHYDLSDVGGTEDE